MKFNMKRGQLAMKHVPALALAAARVCAGSAQDVERLPGAGQRDRLPKFIRGATALPEGGTAR
jgi:hypothetical protein